MFRTRVAILTGVFIAVTVGMASAAGSHGQSLIDAVKRGDTAGAAALLRTAATADTAETIQKLAEAMLTEENRLFVERGINADRTQRLSSTVTIAGSSLVVAFAGISIVLLRRSAQARDAAEVALRDANLIGNGPEVLRRIYAVATDFDMTPGTCGKAGQSVPVGCGQATLRITGVTLGGTA